jgi:tripartite-type tricarboxylate transporter receptor subunit TctC
MIVPFPAVDVVARIIADKLGQPIIIDNRGGVGGVIGTRAGQKPRARVHPDRRR